MLIISIRKDEPYGSTDGELRRKNSTEIAAQKAQIIAPFLYEFIEHISLLHISFSCNFVQEISSSSSAEISKISHIFSNYLNPVEQDLSPI